MKATTPREKSKATSGKKKRKRKRTAPKLSRQHKPPEMSVEEWQRGLRRQFGREQRFQLKNLGDQPVFSEFQVTNPQSRRSYRVAIRGDAAGVNFCSCPDFATNALGTCKHVEFVLGKLSRKPGVKAALRKGFTPPHSEVRLRYGAGRQVAFHPGSDCPPGLRRLAERFFDDGGVLRDSAFASFDTFLADAARFEHDLRCYEDVLGFVAEVRDGEHRRRIIDKAFPKGNESPGLDKLVRVPLYDYQKQGALFAARAGRCLIGDEMGLGKTIQAIAAVEIMAAHLGVERVLVICPTSLKHQWEREIGRFVKRTAQVVGGLRARREQDFKVPAFYKITNYDAVHADLDLISAWGPDLVILDEAQRIKNWNTRAARSVKQVASPYAIVLTGTPLENRLEELVSIVQFVDPHRLGPTYRFIRDHQVTDEHGKVIGYRDLDTIGRTLEPVLIRRRKSQVLTQLPARLDKNLFVPMTPEQMKHHEENKEVVGRIVTKWRARRHLSEADQRRLMIALQNMRMSCDSTYLLDHETDFGVKADELATQLEEIYERPDIKVVIFSQWLRMHEFLVRRFERKRWGHVLFHGGVPGSGRKALVDRFREEDRCRAFLSTDAGGVGLNLQHASVVVNMDVPWNPAVLEQRIGRVHRLGQSRPVQVVNFVAQGTIEEGMLSLISFKRSLFAGALDGGEREVFLGGSRLNRFMETVEKATTSIPEATLETPAAPDAGHADDVAGEPTDGAPADAGAVRPGGNGQAAESGSGPAASGAEQPAAATDPWSGLLTAGLTILEQLAAASRAGGEPAASGTPSAAGIASPAVAGLSIVRRDEATGEQYIRLPLPSPDVLDRVLQSIGQLLAHPGR